MKNSKGNGKQTINYLCKMNKQVFFEDVSNQFACQCGKKYKAFPALYLHFQRSHKIRISTNLRESLCEVSKLQKVRTFTYFYSKHKQKGENQVSHQKSLDKLFYQFADSIENQWDRYPAIFLCRNLGMYLTQENTFNSINNQIERLSSIPSYFNGFMAVSQPFMMSEEIYHYNCNLLLMLGRWLNFKGYSMLKIEFANEIYIKSETDFPSDCQNPNSI